jgi:GNAT superfamily N-acetyltransferase
MGDAYPSPSVGSAVRSHHEELEIDMNTKSHLPVEIKPVRRGDELLIQEIFDAMSPESRYHRFLQATPVLSMGMRRMLADVDGHKHRAWSAHVEDRPVGVVRVIVDQNNELELSVSVADTVQGRGIGRRLVETALKAASETGHREVAVLIHPENRASARLFRSLGGVFLFEFGLLAGRVPTGATRLEGAAA